MKTNDFERLWQFFSSAFFVTMFGLTGGIICFVAGIYISLYLIPPWVHSEIDTEGRIFEEIVGYDVSRNFSVDQAEIVLFLETQNGDLFSYSNDKWSLVDPAAFENTSGYFQSSPGTCYEFDETPPIVIFQNVKQTVSVPLADSYFTIKNYCFVLKKDGMFVEWVRTITFEDNLFFASSTMIVGIIFGGLIGWRRVKQRNGRNV